MNTHPSKNRFLPVLRQESGFAIVEVLVAAIIFVIGSLATFQILDAATRNKLRTEQRQVGLDRAQREIEKLRDVSYGSLAMTGFPSGSSNQTDPRWRVHGTDFALNRDGTSDAAMVVNGTGLYGGGTVNGGTVNPGPEHFMSGDISGDIFRFVVWRDDPNCAATCPGTQDLKRVIVAVRIDAKAQTGQRSYMETQSDFINPQDSALSSLPPGPSGSVTAQQFFLSDTPCAAIGTTSRVAPSADHALHNTLGLCSSGAHTGTTAGAPDALHTGTPPGTVGDPTYDYANDAALEPSPNTDMGLQLVRQDINGCTYVQTSGTKIHRWVTDQMASSFTMAGQATLVLYTQTINGAQMPGKICIYLFTRSAGVDTQILNSADGNAYFTYAPATGTNWPSNGWTRINVTVFFPPTTVVATQRLGVALSLDHSAQTDGFQFLYDHVDFPARLEVSTTTPLSG
jgi:hypothetical protein